MSAAHPKQKLVVAGQRGGMNPAPTLALLVLLGGCGILSPKTLPAKQAREWQEELGRRSATFRKCVSDYAERDPIADAERDAAAGAAEVILFSMDGFSSYVEVAGLADTCGWAGSIEEKLRSQ